MPNATILLSLLIHFSFMNLFREREYKACPCSPFFEQWDPGCVCPLGCKAHSFVTYQELISCYDGSCCNQLLALSAADLPTWTCFSNFYFPLQFLKWLALHMPLLAFPMLYHLAFHHLPTFSTSKTKVF